MMLLCPSHKFRRTLIIPSTSFPMDDVSDIGLWLDGALFGLFFFSMQVIRTADLQSLGSCPVFHVMLMSLKAMPLLPRLMIISLVIWSLPGALCGLSFISAAFSSVIVSACVKPL